MKLEQLRTFLAVVEQGSFTRAAEARGLSQSTVSFHIDALERGVDARLLDRGGGRARPTHAGRLLSSYATKITALATEAAARLQTSVAEPAGSLVLRTSTIVSEYLLPVLVSRYRARFPRVRVTAEVSDSRDALQGLASRQCELAMVGAPVTDRRFESEPFAEDDIVLVGPAGGVVALAGPEALVGYPLVLREIGSGTRSAVADLLAHASVDRADVLHVGSTEAARRCVAEGLGYTFISRRAVAHDVERGAMRVVELPGTPVRRLFHVARLRSDTLSPAARAFYELTVQR